MRVLELALFRAVQQKRALSTLGYPNFLVASQALKSMRDYRLCLLGLVALLGV